MKKNKFDKLKITLCLNVVLLAAFFTMIAWGVYLVRDKLLLNANEMGTYLAQSYAAEEENRIAIYKLFMNLGSVYVNEAIDGGEGDEIVQEWLARYSSNITQALGADIIDPYAVINGHIVAASPWEGDESYDYTETEWYKKAMEADGAIIFTDSYSDAITGKKLVTIAKKLNGNGNVLAFDILLEKFHVHKNRANIPEKSSYFLFDGNGELMHIVSDIDVTDSVAQKYIRDLLEKIEGGSMDSHEATIMDINNNNRGVYYYRMENGWLSVITIPIESILQDGWDSIVVFLLVLCGGLVIILAVLMVRSYLGELKGRHTENTLRILGDTFYAIYRINYDTETYVTVKSSNDVRESLGKSGDYSHLLEVVKECVEKRVYSEFENSFSIDNIRELVRKDIHEYGGDYKRRFGGEYKWVSIRVMYNKDMSSNEVIMCFRDIDEEKRKQLQQQILLENALNSAKQTVEKKNAFFSNVSHDMRTPLNAIIGLADLAKKNRGNDERVYEYIDKIENAGVQLLNLVNDILDLARIEQGEGSKLDYAPMRLKACVEECVSMFEGQVKKGNKKLIIKADDEDLTVYCDRLRLSQILNNLISNAVKYSLEGAVITVELKLTARHKKMCKYQLAVSDTGIGMSAEFLDKIFEPFARETMFAPANVSGVGLGMPIVKSIVQQMSGEITVQSELGKGSVFTVTLPLQIAEEVQPAQEEQYQTMADLSGRTIMIAEDNEINMEIASEYVSMLGAEVVKAWNGREAVEIFSAMEVGSIDAILMDMQMPEMDGCTACENIRAMDRSDAKTVPIIAVTANAFAEDIARTTKAGMNGHISKPIDFALLAGVLSKAVGREEDISGS